MQRFLIAILVSSLSGVPAIAQSVEPLASDAPAPANVGPIQRSASAVIFAQTPAPEEKRRIPPRYL